MGWSTGTEIFEELIDTIFVHVPDPSIRQKIYGEMLIVFENKDWDNAEECLGEDPAYDEAYYKHLRNGEGN